MTLRLSAVSRRAAKALAAIVTLASCRARPTEVAPARAPAALAHAEQLVVVTTPTWDATAARLWRFSRAGAGAPWRLESGPTPAVVGRTGLAWGVGFDAEDPTGRAPHKREGDGKSPAGAFPVDTAFGFAAPDEAGAIRLPYAQLTPASDCVDDTASAHYNTVVERDRVPRVDWNSAEHMRAIGQYAIGAIVGYNTAPAPGRGSCIFLHIWAGTGSSTAGCTALDRAPLERLVAWLDPRRSPVVVQLPEAEYAARRASWGLPATR